MGKPIRSRPGDFVALPLPSGGYAYGRILDKLIAFYDLRSDKLVDTDRIARSRVLFVTAVRAPPISNDRWRIVGNRPLELELRGETKFFRRNPSGRGFLIYVSKSEPPRAYEEHEASADECRGLEPLLVWEADQIEQRIDDYFHNRENVHLSHYLRQLGSEDQKTLH